MSPCESGIPDRVIIRRLGGHRISRVGAIGIAGGGQCPLVLGPLAPADVLSRVHGGVLTHVVAACIEPDGVVHDSVHDGVGVHS